MIQKNSSPSPKKNALPGEIILLGVVQIVVALLSVIGYSALISEPFLVYAIVLMAALAAVILVGAVVSLINLYACVVYLLDAKPDRKSRTVAIGFIVLSIGLLLVATWVGVRILVTI